MTLSKKFKIYAIAHWGLAVIGAPLVVFCIPDRPVMAVINVVLVAINVWQAEVNLKRADNV